MKMWTNVTEVARLNNDFNAHFAFYDSCRLLSFIWDGMSEYITVAHGGYGEPIEWVIPALVIKGTPGQCLEVFEEHCRSAIPEWDDTIWNDNDFVYSCPRDCPQR